MKQIKYIADIGAEKSLVEFTDSTKIRIVESTDLIEHLNKQFSLTGVVKSLRDEMAIGFAQTKMQVWDSELTNKHREKVLEDWLRRNGEDLTIAENIVKDAYFLADEMIRLR